MLVCHCKALSDRDVRRAVGQGARTRGQVARACGAGAGCGGCHEAIDEILQDSSTTSAAPAGGPGLALAPSR